MHRPVRWTRSGNKGLFRRCWQGSHKHVLILRLEKRPSTRHSNILCNLFVKFTDLTMIILIPPDWRYNVVLVWPWNNVIASIKVQLQCKLIRLGSKSQCQPLGKKRKKAILFFICLFFFQKELIIFSQMILVMILCYTWVCLWLNESWADLSLQRWSLLCLCVLSMMMSVVVVLIIVPNSRGDSIFAIQQFCKCPHTGRSLRL